jgi:putative MATE family efflux protein
MVPGRTGASVVIDASGLTKLRPSYKTIWGISFPIIIAGISETVVEVTDTIFLAHYGLTELAAVGVAASIYGVAMFLTLGLVDGIQIIIARRSGEGHNHQVGEIFNQGIYMLSLAALGMILLVVLVLPLVTANLFASEAIHTKMNAYLRISAHALLFQAFNLAYSAFFVGISKTRVLIAATAILAVTNVVLDYSLIFGNLGFEEYGIEGAAIATLSAEIAAFLFLTGVILRRGYNRTYNMLRFGRWKSELFKKLVNISTPVSLEALVSSLKWFLFFLMIEQLGEEQLGIASIIFSCYAVLLIPIDSFSESACSMASNLIGQKRQHDLARLIRRIIVLNYAITFPALVLSILFPENILAIFTADETLMAKSVGSLGVVVLAILVAIPADALFSTIVGTGDTRAILIIQIVTTTITLLCVYVAAFILTLGLHFIWMAEAFGWLICLLLSAGWFKSGLWNRLNI